MVVLPIHSLFSSFKCLLGLCTCIISILYIWHDYQMPSFLLESAFAPLKPNGSLNWAASEKRTQHFALCCSLQVNRIKIPKQIDELIEIESDTGTWYRRCFVRIHTELYGVSNKPVWIVGQLVSFEINQKQDWLTNSMNGFLPTSDTWLLDWDQVIGSPWDHRGN